MVCSLCGVDEELEAHKCSLLDNIKAHQQWEIDKDKKRKMIGVGLTPYPHNMTKEQWEKWQLFGYRKEAMNSFIRNIKDDQVWSMQDFAEQASKMATAMIKEGDK